MRRVHGEPPDPGEQVAVAEHLEPWSP